MSAGGTTAVIFGGVHQATLVFVKNTSHDVLCTVLNKLYSQAVVFFDCISITHVWTTLAVTL
jgi:hypothetical protein